MSIILSNHNNEKNNNIESQSKYLEKSSQKFTTKVKIGKDIFIYRTLYLIAKENLFKNKSNKQIGFFLKSQIKLKSLLHLPGPRETDIIIEDIRELIELVLSLIILTNSSNYKISVFTSSFENILNDAQLLKYQGQVLYAKINEFKNISNKEEHKNLQTLDSNKKTTNFTRINKFMNKIRNNKEFTSINLKQLFPDKKFGITLISDNNKLNNKTSINNVNYKNITIIQRNQGLLNSYKNIFINDNSNKYNDESDNILHTKNTYLQIPNIYQSKKYTTSNSNLFLTKSPLPDKILRKSNSDLNVNSTTTYRFKPQKLNFFWQTMNENNSRGLIKSNSMYYESSKIKNKTNFENKTNNKFNNKKKKLESLRFSYFSKENKTFFDNSSKDYDKLNKLFAINEKYKKENVLLDIVKKNRRQIQNIKLIQNFLNRPSIITPSRNSLFSPENERFDGIKNIFFSFKKKLKELSQNLDEYILDEDIERFFNDIDESFKRIGFSLVYCIKEYFLYAYFDKYLNYKFPELNEKNNLYDLDITPEQIKEMLNALFKLIKKLEGKNKYDLVNYVRSLKNIKSCQLSSDFFQIFIFCPDYFQLTKREITKKYLLVLEIDCVKNKVTIDNFINYYHIFRYGHLVKLEQRLYFINRILHLLEVKGNLLQDKVASDIEYLFKIDKRTKQVLLGKIYDIKLNYHQHLKVNQIFESMINYFVEPEKQNIYE